MNIQVRRIQLRFKSSADFDTVYSHLRALGLNMSDPRPSTAVSTLTSNSIHSPVLSSPPPRGHEPVIQPSTISSSNTTTRKSSPLARNPFPGTNISPNSLAMYPSTDMCDRPQHPETGSFSFNPIVPPEYFQRPDSSGPGIPHPSDDASASRTGQFVTPEYSHTTDMSSSPATLRPRSEDMLPPRRALPFSHSLSKSSSNIESAESLNRPFTSPLSLKPSASKGICPSGRASSGSMGPPPLPSPSVVTRSNTTRPNPIRDMTNTLVPTFTLEVAEPPHPSSSSRPSSAALPELPPLPTPTFIEEPRDVANTTPSSRTLDFETRRDGLPFSELSTGAKTMQSSPPPSAAAPRPDLPDHDRLFQELHKETSGIANEHLKSYSARTAEERREILDDFMMNLIDDDDFLKLVEDVSTCWTRVGLGLQ